MGSNSSRISRKQKGSLKAVRTADSKVPRTVSLPSIPSSINVASLSCLAAEHHHIYNQDSLDEWRAKALHTINDLYEQKVSRLRHEEHVKALLGQLRAAMNVDLPPHENSYPIDDYYESHIQTGPDDGLNGKMNN